MWIFHHRLWNGYEKYAANLLFWVIQKKALDVPELFTWNRTNQGMKRTNYGKGQEESDEQHREKKSIKKPEIII